jgi:prepilin-type N-terminal cleavage/methylation domain-containing protein
MNKQKGFTIIELVVVIAIIAILASIVLVNVTTYINRAKDGAAVENMHALQTAAIAFAGSQSSPNYNGVKSDTEYSRVATAIGLNYTLTDTCTTEAACNTSTDLAWCASIVKVGGAVYCVDSTRKVGSSTCASGVCP